MLTLREKEAYLIDLYFKFNEIKFCAVLMNWLIWEKIFTYLYNKFRHVNRMYYTKCGVNHYSHNSGCCIRSVVSWITVLSQHIVFTFVCYFAKQGITYRSTSHLAHCALSLAARRTQMAEQLG